MLKPTVIVDEAEYRRLLAIASAAELVTKKFEKDEAQGYHTKDREFAITMFRKALYPT